MTAMDSGRGFYAGLLQALTMVMGTAKGYLRGHGPRVAMLARQLGREAGLSDSECSELFFAAVLSDMGMVGLAEQAWEDPTPMLSPEVRARVELHPERSEERVRDIPHLGGLAPLARHHHEWWDGSGYPDGLSGSEIPLGARILRVSDTVAALGQERPHRGALDAEEIQGVVREGRGREFGPDVTDTYLRLRESDLLPAL